MLHLRILYSSLGVSSRWTHLLDLSRIQTTLCCSQWYKFYISFKCIYYIQTGNKRNNDWQLSMFICRPVYWAEGWKITLGIYTQMQFVIASVKWQFLHNICAKDQNVWDCCAFWAFAVSIQLDSQSWMSSILRLLFYACFEFSKYFKTGRLLGVQHRMCIYHPGLCMGLLSNYNVYKQRIEALEVSLHRLLNMHIYYLCSCKIRIYIA
jgi:hypothetical protein